MKKLLAPILAFTVITISFILSSTFAQEDREFNVARMVVSAGIEDREPVGVAETFISSTATEKVYCFLEAKDITEDTNISFVWYFEEKEKARVTLPLFQGSRWRTYSTKNLAGLKGDWKVELQNANGIILKTVKFTVQ